MTRTAASCAPPPARASVNLRVADLVVLAIVCGCVLDVSSRLLSVRNPLVQSVLVIAWTAAAARRLVAWRHGGCRAVAIGEAPQAITIIAGMAPWFLLPLVHNPFQGGPLWAPIALPLWLRVFGACLMMSGVLGPFVIALGGRRAVAGVGGAPFRDSIRPDLDAYAPAIGFFLLCSSPIVAVLTSGWLALRYCADREQPALTRSFATFSTFSTGTADTVNQRGAAA